jgi:murein DD-endopeptidase MepM/ murein hydrolase activator NlpD
MKMRIQSLWVAWLAITVVLGACQPHQSGLMLDLEGTAESTPTAEAADTPMPTRPPYDPGTLVDYNAQTGDTLLGLAVRFNTTEAEIRAANPIIPEDATTMPPGFPMQIPIYYRAFWGSPFRILPDGLYVNGPAQVEFDTAAFVAEQEGWFKNFRGTAAQEVLTGAEIVDRVATNFSISPRFLLALLEERTGALSDPNFDPNLREYPLGYRNQFHQGLYLQLVWAANLLNNGFYAWRGGKLIEFEQPDGQLLRPDPWQTASSVALQHYYAQTLSMSDFQTAIGPDGFAAAYTNLFGDPWAEESDHIPGSLAQPELRLPFGPNELWSLTGGPHTGWGEGEPWAALDFAPGANTKGCVDTDRWARAMAGGTIVRTGEGIAVLDLDGDGDERTGWVLFYLHLASDGKAKVGDVLVAGQPVGQPSCEGGESTGTHVHVARKYNGEWMLAAGDVPFVMEDWIPQEGATVYLGSLVKPGRAVVACTCSDAASAITSISEPVDLPTPAASLE